jgi:hypothetical protein
MKAEKTKETSGPPSGFGVFLTQIDEACSRAQVETALPLFRGTPE